LPGGRVRLGHNAIGVVRRRPGGSGPGARLGFGSFGVVRVGESPAGPHSTDWNRGGPGGGRRQKPSAPLRLGAFYQNRSIPETEQARAILKRAIECWYLGSRRWPRFRRHRQTRFNERGGNPVYEPFENHLPQVLGFWSRWPRRAADVGVRIAFEHCPQAPFHLPVMGYNTLDRPACGNGSSTHEARQTWVWNGIRATSSASSLTRSRTSSSSCRACSMCTRRCGLDRDSWPATVVHPGVAEHRFPGLGEANWGRSSTRSSATVRLRPEH